MRSPSMTNKELILQELEEIPDSLMAEVLQTIRQFKQFHSQTIRSEVWDAYLESINERQEVYQRLADS